ncbi:MAG TPA: hypothetical protein EYQ18_06255 [Candidatus Handelsmanbacteria bacterium]|nr:hypothetical protein [Candidatus Handelsmanbacteria bacterium]
MLQDHLDMVNDLLNVVEAAEQRLGRMDWAERDRVNHRTSYIFERFHLSHVCCNDHVSWSDMEDCERRLAALGCKLCVVRIDGVALVDRHRERGTQWQEVVRGWGVAEGKVADFLLRRQDQFIARSCQPALEVHIVDMSAITVEDGAVEVLDFWGIC